MSAEPLTPEELADLAEAINRDYEFTYSAPHDMTGGPAITAHLLYTIRDLGPRLLDHLSALSQELKAARETDVAKSQLITDWRKLAETDHAGRVAAEAEVQRLREVLREYHHIVESDLIRDGWDHPINRCSCGEFECETAADLVSLSNRQSDMEERANRYQMQYEMECEIHGETRAEVQRLRGELRSGSRPSPG